MGKFLSRAFPVLSSLSFLLGLWLFFAAVVFLCAAVKLHLAFGCDILLHTRARSFVYAVVYSHRV
jgi:hypothetical protein